MPRLRLTVAYDGTDFSGWQIQAGTPDRTVQGCLEEIVARMCETPIRLAGSGRTDAGVHSLGQVVHLDIPDSKADIDWQRALNAQLPPDVSVVDAALVSDQFHARFSAKSKVYTYSLWLNGRYVIPQRRNFVWPTGPLDLDAMDAAARHLVGKHDFKTFQNVGTPVKSTVRTVSDISRASCRHPDEMVWRFQADGFLKQMVRNLMGLLVAVGQGRFSPDDVPGLVAACDRSAAFATAPPQGLCLKRVIYPPA